LTNNPFSRYAAYLVLAALLTFAATLPTTAAPKNHNANTVNAAVAATPTPVVETAPVAMQTATPAPARTPQTPQKSSPVGWIVLGLIGLAILAYFLLRNRGDGDNSGGSATSADVPYSSYGSTTPRTTAAYTPTPYSPTPDTQVVSPDAPAAVEAQADGGGGLLSSGTLVPEQA
jgi:hypothetical protein